MLPGMDGLEVCSTLRREGDVPIIMLTARDEEVDRVIGLELGADDYMVKPFSVRELLARIKTVLRRTKPVPASEAETLRVGGLALRPDRHEVLWDADQLQLSTLEFDLLHTFMRHPGQVLGREQLLSQVWGYDYPGDLRTVDTAVKRLRAKLREASGEAAGLLITVRGVGYKLSDEA
jgi:DNA-binding response OmpR family regulator